VETLQAYLRKKGITHTQSDFAGLFGWDRGALIKWLKAGGKHKRRIDALIFYVTHYKVVQYIKKHHKDIYKGAENGSRADRSNQSKS